MAEKRELTIVLIKDYWSGFWQSIAWLSILAVFMGFGVWIGSSAMQWMMAIFWFISLIDWAMGERTQKRLTPEDAMAEIKKHIKATQ